MSFATLFTCVQAFPNEAWNRQRLSENPNVTLTVVQTLDVTHPDWDWSALTNNVPLEDLRVNLSLPWDWTVLSSRWDLDMDFLIDNPSAPWDWMYVSCFANLLLTGSDVAAHPEFDWDYDILSWRIPVGEMLANPSVPWNWDWVKYNSSLVFDHIVAHPEIDWDFDTVSSVSLPDDYGLFSAKKPDTGKKEPLVENPVFKKKLAARSESVSSD